MLTRVEKRGKNNNNKTTWTCERNSCKQCAKFFLLHFSVLFGNKGESYAMHALEKGAHRRTFRARRGGKRFNTEQIICYQIVNKLLNCAGFEVKSVRVDVHMLGSQRFFCDQEVRKFLSQIWHTSEKLCLY